MSDSAPQSFKSHARFDPPYHFITATVLAVNLFIVCCFAWKNLNWFSEWLVVLSVAVWIPVLKLRSYPLKVQDRVIGLRFASDDEVVELAKQALEQNLTRKQIKERIKTWRPDDWRV